MVSYWHNRCSQTNWLAGSCKGIYPFVHWLLFELWFCIGAFPVRRLNDCNRTHFVFQCPCVAVSHLGHGMHQYETITQVTADTQRTRSRSTYELINQSGDLEGLNTKQLLKHQVTYKGMCYAATTRQCPVPLGNSLLGRWRVQVPQMCALINNLGLTWKEWKCES